LKLSDEWSRAALRIYGESLDLGEVEGALGLKPTGTHSRGMRRSPRYAVTWPDSMWRYGTALNEDRGLEGNLTWLLDSIESKQDAIQKFAEDHRVDFFCGFSPGEKRGGFTVTSATLARISKFSVPLIMNLSPPTPEEGEVEEHELERGKWSAASFRVIGNGLLRTEIEARLALKATEFCSARLWQIPGGATCRGSLWLLHSPPEG
jgi:Domain of unknown function (DUF4279)